MTDWNEHEDAISDAISDSIDMDWTSRTGAKAVIVWLNENAAAPVPSSLAGGEITNEQIQSVMLAAIKEVRATVTDVTEGACMDADIIRMERGLVDMGDTGWAVMRAVHRRLAALSPEAPAREGVKYTIRQEYGFGITEHDPALTPRHEAPAEGTREAIDEEWRALVGSSPDAFANPASIMHDEFAVAVKGVLSALRLRSSAPEAREGEAN